jgi:hypothetical protein
VGIYDSKIRKEEQAVRDARLALADAKFRGDAGRARQAAEAVDVALDNISALKTMEKYRATD